MRILMVVFLAGCIAGGFCASTGATLPLVGWDEWLSGRVEGALLFIVCAAMLFGIYTRAPIVWPLGRILLLALCIYFVARALPWWRSRGPAAPSMQSHSAMFLLAALCGYLTFLWYSERGHFTGRSKPRV